MFPAYHSYTDIYSSKVLQCNNILPLDKAGQVLASPLEKKRIIALPLNEVAQEDPAGKLHMEVFTLSLFLDNTRSGFSDF